MISSFQRLAHLTIRRDILVYRYLPLSLYLAVTWPLLKKFSFNIDPFVIGHIKLISSLLYVAGQRRLRVEVCQIEIVD